ncbi:hypothetical protein GWK47_001334 [Chionoecetes opilio]|uniref:Integrase catalytic domain-containing protein n=1 Tax=Chionoecetes opilio TaxID=41210 RepID=A0A8J4XXH6_CHIOP|nr:hypothetical protein GWK47_001334 [Chionoecetes opilio]
MWQYLADYGTPRNIVLDNGGEFTSREFQQFCTRHQKHSCYTPPPSPSRKFGDREDAQDPEVSPLDLCQRAPSELAHVVAAVPNHYESSGTHLHWTTNPKFAFFSRHAPRLVGAALPDVEGEQDDMGVATP